MSPDSKANVLAIIWALVFIIALIGAANGS
jgi:hypothetical protein